jgi:hypothetical protein
VPNQDHTHPPRGTGDGASTPTKVAAHGGALGILGAAVAVGIASDSEAVQITALVVGGAVVLGHTWLSVGLHRH